MIKKILFLITFVTSILFFSSGVGANKQKKEEAFWQIGDTLYAAIICNTEKDILEIGYADSKSLLQLRQLIQIKILTNSCVSFNPPLQLAIATIIGEYKDYQGEYTVMVGVSPAGEPENILGYLIVLGRPLTI